MDVSNAGQIREELLLAINRGATTLIADMTATISCDHAGADAVARAYQRAASSGAQLRLVVTAPVVSRMLSLAGLDRLIPIYPSLEAARAASAPAVVPAPIAATARTGSPRTPRRSHPRDPRHRIRLPCPRHSATFRTVQRAGAVQVKMIWPPAARV
jgi:anti-sigma B factor antagonist